MAEVTDHSKHQGHEIDPVCHMTVDPSTARHRQVHRGRTSYFCSAKCVERFVADPQKYLAPAVTPPATASVLDEHRSSVDDVICLKAPRSLGLVGAHFDDFSQVDDWEVVRLLKLVESARRDQASASRPEDRGSRS